MISPFRHLTLFRLAKHGDHDQKTHGHDSGVDNKRNLRDTADVKENLPRFSEKLEAEIAHKLNAAAESADPDEPVFTRGAAIKELMQDADLPETTAHEFKRELEDFGIAAGIFTPKTKAQIANIVSIGRGKKYDFKRGEVYYRFESWKPLENS